MSDSNYEYITSLLDKLSHINHITPGEVPNIDLYMDQVTTFMDEHLGNGSDETDKVFTKTMINNYTKNNLLPPPVKKKYSKEHIYVLIFIYYMKNLLPISDIQKMINPLTDYSFSKESDPGMLDIYMEIFNQCSEMQNDISQDILKKYSTAAESFDDINDEKEKEFLKLMSLVSLLCYDVYMKKAMIHSLIDDYIITSPKEKKNNVNSDKL